MTCKEKLKIEHPDKVSDRYLGGCYRCPSSFGYLEDPPYCVKLISVAHVTDETCQECWDREIPSVENKEIGEKNMCELKRKTKQELIEDIKEMRNDLERLERYEQYETGANEMRALLDSFINAGFTRQEAFDLLKNCLNKINI